MGDNKKLFDYQFDLIQKELDHINESIGRIDSINQGVKNWAIALWTGSVVLALGKDNTSFNGYVSITTVIPLVFWYLEAWWKRIQKGFIYRNVQISKYLNSEKFKESFDKGEFIEFNLIDLRGSQTGDKKEYQKWTNVLRTASFRSVSILYIGLILFSLTLGLLLSKSS